MALVSITCYYLFVQYVITSIVGDLWSDWRRKIVASSRGCSLVKSCIPVDNLYTYMCTYITYRYSVLGICASRRYCTVLYVFFVSCQTRTTSRHRHSFVFDLFFILRKKKALTYLLINTNICCTVRLNSPWSFKVCYSLSAPMVPWFPLVMKQVTGSTLVVFVDKLMAYFLLTEK